MMERVFHAKYFISTASGEGLAVFNKKVVFYGSVTHDPCPEHSNDDDSANKSRLDCISFKCRTDFLMRTIVIIVPEPSEILCFRNSEKEISLDKKQSLLGLIYTFCERLELKVSFECQGEGFKVDKTGEDLVTQSTEYFASRADGEALAVFNNNVVYYTELGLSTCCKCIAANEEDEEDEEETYNEYDRYYLDCILLKCRTDFARKTVILLVPHSHKEMHFLNLDDQLTQGGMLGVTGSIDFLCHRLKINTLFERQEPQK